MFVPIGDTPNPKQFTPWVTYALIAANVLIFLICVPRMLELADPQDPFLHHFVNRVATEVGMSQAEATELAAETTRYDLTLFRYGFRPAAPSVVGLVASMFLHAGVAHLLGNMLFLWIFGDNVERRLGRGAYLGLYLGWGVIAALGDGGLRMGSHLSGVGASGAISGVIGAYFVWFPYNRVRVVVFIPPVLIPVAFFELPARVVLTVLVLVDNMFDLVLEFLLGRAGGVAHGAHLGGFFAGLVMAWAWARWCEPWHPDHSEYSGAEQLGFARAYLDHRLPTAAYQEVCRVLDRDDSTPQDRAQARAILFELQQRTGGLPARHQLE